MKRARWPDDIRIRKMEVNATQPVLAPRLKLSDLSGRALMIHAGGDNHSDQPAMLGGGGARIICGVIK